MNNLQQENKKLEEYISEIKNFSEMIEKTKQENDYLQMVYDKNVLTISSKFIVPTFFFNFTNNIFLYRNFLELKEEMFNSNQVSFDKLLPLDLDEDILGFDSVSLTVSKSVLISISSLLFY